MLHLPLSRVYIVYSHIGKDRITFSALIYLLKGDDQYKNQIIMEIEDQGAISVINSPSSTISFIFEFAETDPEVLIEDDNGNRVQGTGNQLNQVAFCSSLTENNSYITAEKSPKEESGFSSNGNVTHQTISSNVVGKIKRFSAGRKSQESNLIQTSIFDAEQPSTVNPPQTSISKSKETSVMNVLHSSTSNSLPQATSSRGHRPSTATMNLSNGVMIPRPLNFQIPRKDVCREKISKKRQLGIPDVVKTGPNNNNHKTIICEEDISNKRQQQELVMAKTFAINNKHKTIEAKRSQCGQITSSTKLALWNFLKKKSSGNGVVADVENEGTDLEEQIVSIVQKESSGVEIEEPHSDEMPSCENEVEQISTRTVFQEEVPTAEFSSTNQVQSDQNADKTSDQDGLNEAQSDNANQLDVVGLNTENDEERKKGGNNSQTVPKEADNTTADVLLCDESTPSIHEIDVVVHPSLLQPTENGENMKKIERQKGTGVKKKKKNKSLECKECGKMLASVTTYLEHMNIHYDRRPYKCDECGKSFRQRHHIDQHKIVHTGKKPFVCQYCDKAFARSYNMKDHERIHTGEKPCKCSHCDKTFRRRRGLREHETNVHHLHMPRNKLGNLKEKKVYTCKICAKTFTWSSALSTHKKTHSDIARYKCPKCKKAFKNNSLLWNHVKTHSKEKPFECDICGQRLKRRGNLKRHILTQHEPEVAEECLKTSKEFEYLRRKKSG